MLVPIGLRIDARARQERLDKTVINVSGRVHGEWWGKCRFFYSYTFVLNSCMSIAKDMQRARDGTCVYMPGEQSGHFLPIR